MIFRLVYNTRTLPNIWRGTCATSARKVNRRLPVTIPIKNFIYKAKVHYGTYN